jgi:GNS1/SUR4 family
MDLVKQVEAFVMPRDSPLAVSFWRADLEVVPPGMDDVFGHKIFPAEGWRIKLDGGAPLMWMVASAILYAFVLVPFVFPLCRSVLPRGLLQWARSKHNLILCLFSLYVCLYTLSTMHLDGTLYSWKKVLCTPVEGTPLRFVSTLFALSKIYEWGDTLFLVALGTRKPEFLHLYHHATTFWLFCLVFNLPGPERYGMLLNGGVHFFMYWHYYRSWPKALVPLITILQIAQLSFVIYSWYASPLVCPNASWASGPSADPVPFHLPYLMVPVYLGFFLMFFVKRFILGSRGTPRSSGSTKKTQ